MAKNKHNHGYTLVCSHCENVFLVPEGKTLTRCPQCSEALKPFDFPTIRIEFEVLGLEGGGADE